MSSFNDTLAKTREALDDLDWMLEWDDAGIPAPITDQERKDLLKEIDWFITTLKGIRFFAETHPVK